MEHKILLSSSDTGPLEEDYVLHAMRSGWVAPAGPDLTAFEQEVAARVGVAHAVRLCLRHGGSPLGAGEPGRRSW